MRCHRVCFLLVLLLLGGCSGDSDSSSTTTTAAGAAAGATTTQVGAAAGGTTTTAGGTSAGPRPAACSLLTDERARRVIGPGNEGVSRVDQQVDEDHCLYNSLVKLDESRNGGNLELSLAETAIPLAPDGARRLPLGDESYLAPVGETFAVYVRLGTTLMTLSLQPSPNNPRLAEAPAQDALVAVASEIVAALCPPRC